MSRDPPIPLRPDVHAREREQRRALHRTMAAHALAKLHGMTPDAIVAKNWPGDVLTRAAVSPTDTISAAPYAPVVTGNALTGLAPASAAARLFEHPNTIKLDFKGVASYSIPRGTLTPVPIFIGETQPMPMSQLAMASTTVGPTRKILLGTGISEELEFASGNTAASVLGTLIGEQAALSLDDAVFDANAASALRPAGLLNGALPIAPIGAGGNTPGERVAGDIANMAQAIADAGISIAGLVLVAGASAAVKLKLLSGPLFDHEILETTALPGTTVIAIQPAAIATGFTGAPTVEVSKHAVAHWENTTPLPIASPGSPNTVAAVTRSAYQSNLLFLKVRLNGAWAVVAPGAVQVVNLVTW
jgi:hypothetical protein